MRADGFDLYAGGTIEHPTGNTQLSGQVVHKGAESHALRNAGDMDAVAQEMTGVS
jgi:hypothetical protein